MATNGELEAAARLLDEAGLLAFYGYEDSRDLEDVLDEIYGPALGPWPKPRTPSLADTLIGEAYALAVRANMDDGPVARLLRGDLPPVTGKSITLTKYKDFSEATKPDP
jgi:hypothetical protein